MTSSLQRISILSRMIATYVARRVLNVGPLRSWGTRALLALTIVFFVIGGAVVAHQFMSPVGKDQGIWLFVYDLSAISVTLLTLGVFLGLRVVFGGSSSFLRLTHQLPVTQQERRAAMLAFEAAVLALILLVLLAAMSIAVALILGPSAIWLASTPLLTAVVVYLAISLVVNGAERLLGLLGLRRARSAVLLLLIFGVIIWFNSLVPTLVVTASNTEPGAHRTFFWVNLMPWVLDAGGPLALAATAAALIGGLAPLVLLTAPSSPEATRRFINVRLPRRIPALWSAHLAYALRNGHLWLGVSLGTALFVFLTLNGSLQPLWAGALLVLPGMYHYGNTRGLRAIHPEGSPLLTYVRIVGSQAAVVSAFLVLLSVTLSIVRPELLPGIASPITGVLGGVVFSVLIGCVFPAEHDNPFSILIGGLVLGICLGFVGILTGLLNLPASVLPPVLLALTVVAVVISITALSTNESRSRHENIPACVG